MTAPADGDGRGTDYVESPVHAWFGLTYSSYFVIPRLALEHLPHDWQERFVALMNEAHDVHGCSTPSDYEVRRRSHGRFFPDPWANYRRGDYDTLVTDQRKIG